MVFVGYYRKIVLYIKTSINITLELHICEFLLILLKVVYRVCRVVSRMQF